MKLNIKILIVALIIIISSSYVSAWTWTDPIPTYPSLGGASEPITTGATSMPWKKGGLILSGSGVGMFVQYGSVGIGTSSPLASSKLHVDGILRIYGGNPAANRTLVSDANGIGTWQNLATSSIPQPVMGINVPSGAVMPFELSTTTGQLHGDCPSGWSRFSPADGRVIISADEGGPYIYRPAPNYNIGGVPKFQLTDVHIPAHYHLYPHKTGGHNDADDDGSGSYDVPNEERDRMTPQEFVPHNNMMPYVGLTYCKKN